MANPRRSQRLRRLRGALPLVAVLLASFVARPVAALACISCGSETSERIRAEVFSASFGDNLLRMLLPFAVLLPVVSVLHRVLRRLDALPSRGEGPSTRGKEGS